MVIILILIHSEMVIQNSPDIQRSLQTEKKSTKADHSTSNKIPLYSKAGVKPKNKNASITTTIVNAASTAANAASAAANAATAAANAATAAANAAIAASNAATATANILKEAVKGFSVLEESFPLIDKEENSISAESTTYEESNLTKQTFKTNKVQDTGERPQEEPLCLCSCLCKPKMSKEKQNASESSSLPGVMSTETRSTSLSSTGTEEETETDILPTKEIKSIICADAIKSTRENIMFNSSTQTILPSYELENMKSDMEVIEKYEDVATVTKSNIITDIEGQETNDMKVSPIGTFSDVAMVTKPNIINEVNTEGLDNTDIKDTIVTDITGLPNGALLPVPEMSEIETGPTDLSTIKHTSTKPASTSTNNMPSHIKVDSNELSEIVFSEPLTNGKTETTIIQNVTDIYKGDRKRLQQTIKTGIGQTQTNNEIISPKETLKTEVALTKSNKIENFENPIKGFKGAFNAVTNTSAPMTIVSPTPLNAYYTSVTEESTCISNEYAEEMVCKAATQIKIRDIPSTTIPPTIEKYVRTTSPLTTDTYSTIENSATSIDVNTKNINPCTLSIKSSILATNCVPQTRKNTKGIQENIIPVYENKSNKPENDGLEYILTRPTHLRTVQTAPGKIDIATEIKGSQLCSDKYESLQEGYTGTMKSEKPLICNNGKLWDVKASTDMPESSSSKMKTQHIAYDSISGVEVPFSYENTCTEENNFMKENEVSKTTRIATLYNKVTSLTPGKARVSMLPKQRSRISQDDCNSLEKIMSIKPVIKSSNSITSMSVATSDIFKSKPSTEKIQNLPYTILMEGNTLRVYDDEIAKENCRIIIGKESLGTGPAITNAELLTSRENVAGNRDTSICSEIHSHEIPQLSEDCLNTPLGSGGNISFDTFKSSSSNTSTKDVLKNISFKKEPKNKEDIYSTNDTKDKIHTRLPITGKLSAVGNQNKSKIHSLPKGKTEMLYETVLSSDSIEAFTIDRVGWRTGGASSTFHQALEDSLSMPLSQCKYGIPNLKAKMPLAVMSASQQEEKNGNLGIIGLTSTASKNTHKRHAKSGMSFQMESNKPKNLSERIALQARLYEADTSGFLFSRRPMVCARSQETIPTKRDASTLTAEEDNLPQPCTTKIKHIPRQW